MVSKVSKVIMVRMLRSGNGEGRNKPAWPPCLPTPAHARFHHCGKWAGR